MSLSLQLQLRPQVLLDRFFAINREADKRIRSELGPIADTQNIRQQIIFGSQKSCSPWEAKDPPCYAVPKSTLPDDIYGSNTDTDAARESSRDTPNVNFRPRFLNAGMGIGTVPAMRKLFKQAEKQANGKADAGSDQHIFSQIFGDQELWREAVRRDAKGPRNSAKKEWSHEHIDAVRQKASRQSDGTFEFGIGIDYHSQIGLNTVSAGDDNEWLRFEDSSQIHAVEADRGIYPPHQRLNNISADIKNSLPPFWTFTVEPDLDRWKQWDEVPLLTNVYTGVAPAIIHHDTQSEDLKSLRESWWDKIWFSEKARILLDTYIYAPIAPIAHSGYNERDMREWWPYEIWKGGARNGLAALGSFGEGEWLRFDDMCRDSHAEVFRDGKGPWNLPQAH